MARTVKGIHFAPQHWTPKKGKRQGRPIGDEANREDGIPINGKTTQGKEAIRAQLREEWGEIHHPTVDELVNMVLSLADEHGWENIVLWKLDLAGAFNLIRFHTDSIRLLAFALTEELTAIHITGMFGWTGTPYAFQVVTRVLSALVKQAISGKCRWYVDDGMGVSHDRDQDSDVVGAKRKGNFLLFCFASSIRERAAAKNSGKTHRTPFGRPMLRRAPIRVTQPPARLLD